MSGLVFEKLTQTLSAGQVWRLSIAADFFRIAAAAWPVKVRILKAGRIMGEMDGWQAGDFVRDVDFDAVEIEAGSIAQEVTVQIAGGGVGSDRVIGEVSVIDGGKFRTIAGQAYSGGHGFTAGAGLAPSVILSNPVGSGVNVVIEGFGAAQSVESFIVVKLGAAGLGTLIRKAANKKSGGAVSKSEIRQDANASILAGAEMYTATPAINTQVAFWPKIPLLIQPGNSAHVIGMGLAARISAWFDFYEEPL